MMARDGTMRPDVLSRLPPTIWDTERQCPIGPRPAGRARTGAASGYAPNPRADRRRGPAPARSVRRDAGGRHRRGRRRLPLDPLPPLPRPRQPPRGGPAAGAGRAAGGADPTLPPGRLGRERPVSLEGIHVFDVVAPPMLPEQLVAEAQRIAGVPLALYVLDIDGSSPAARGRPERLPERIPAPLAIGPELDSRRARRAARRPGRPAGDRGRPALAARARDRRADHASAGRATRSTEMARQAAAAITLADRYTDTFARGAAAQAAAGRGGDPAEPAAAADLAHQRRRGRRQRAALLRGRRRLVRHRREPRRRLDHARRRARAQHARRREQRRRPRRPAGEPAQRRHARTTR